MTAITFLDDVLQQRLNAQSLDWLHESCERFSAGIDQRKIFLHFSMAARRCDKTVLQLNEDEEAAAEKLLPGWQPRYWRCDDAARCLLLLHACAADEATALQLLDDLFQSADLGEARALYLSLPLLPQPQRHVERACEGLRSNIKDIFEAVAHYSPLPQAQFPDSNWNQMVLKALFIESSLDPIYGLEARANPELSTMLLDYADERRAADRSISSELWRCVGACPDERGIASIAQVLKDGSEREQLAAALSIRDCERPDAQAALAAHPAIHEQLTQGLCWQELLANP